MIFDRKEKTVKNKRLITWIKRMGVAGFIFFLLKGLAWLAAAYFMLR